MDASGVLYSDDGTMLISCKNPGSTFTVRDGCRAIGSRAFMYQDSLREVTLPPSIETIGPFAFACTSLERFEAPIALNSIGDKAFFQCTKLRSVALNEQLRHIGNEAFSCTNITDIDLPSSLEHLERTAFAQTPLEHRASGATIRIPEANRSLIIDDDGGLYEQTDEGLVLLAMFSDTVTYHRVLDGTVAIGPRAYLRARSVECVELPQGLKRIGCGAFYNCAALRHVSFPETLECIDDEAFSGSSLEELYLPASFTTLGIHALRTGGYNAGSTIHSVSVHPDNAHFYTESGLLCERSRPHRSFIVLHYGSDPHVVIGDEVVSIGPDAFSREGTISQLDVHAHIESVHPHAFSSVCHIDMMHIGLAQPECGKMHFDLSVPSSGANVILREGLLSFGMLQPAALAESYDRSVLFIREHYARAVAILDRLSCPQFLAADGRGRFIGLLQRNLTQTCLALAEHGDVRRLEQLAELGVLNAANIIEVIDAVGALGDATVTGFLFELKRQRFSVPVFDFAL